MPKIDQKMANKFGIDISEELYRNPSNMIVDAAKTPYDDLISTLKTSIETAQMTMRSSSGVANASEESESYKAYSTTAKAMAELSHQLIELIDKREKFLGNDSKNDNHPATVNNTLVLTTQDAIEHAKRLLQESN